MMKIAIGIDFDGVVGNAVQLKIKVAEQLFGITIPLYKCTREVIIREKILTIEQYEYLKKCVYTTQKYGLCMQPVAGALYYIGRLLRDGHPLVVITSRSGIMLDIAQRWTYLQGLNVPFVGVGYNVSKVYAARGLDIFIDDDLHKLAPLVDIVPHRFLFSWDYNVHEKEEKIATRVSSWKQFYDEIQKRKGD